MIVLALSLALAFPGTAATGSTLPARGVLAPGKSLAGVHLGDTQASVRKRWGGSYRLCTVCVAPTWLYTYGPGALTGAAVSFRAGRATAVFTLGAPKGWRTTQGLIVGQQTERAISLYGRLPWEGCIGYGAMSMRRQGVVTSIYTYGESVYGFALTRPSEPVCQ